MSQFATLCHDLVLVAAGMSTATTASPPAMTLNSVKTLCTCEYLVAELPLCTCEYLVAELPGWTRIDTKWDKSGTFKIGWSVQFVQFCFMLK